MRITEEAVFICLILVCWGFAVGLAMDYSEQISSEIKADLVGKTLE